MLGNNILYEFILRLITILGLVFCLSGYSQNSQRKPFIYISPLPGSKFVSPENNLVLKTGNAFIEDQEEWPLVQLTGTESGIIAGELKLSDDKQALIFKPQQKFRNGEQVLVSVIHNYFGDRESFNFDFEISNTINHYYKPDFQQQLENIYPGLSQVPETDNLSPVLDTVHFLTNDTLPSCYPEIIIPLWESPSPGYTFVYPMKWLWNCLFLIILDNYGTPVYYRTTTNGGMDWKLQPNGLMTFYDVSIIKFTAIDSDGFPVDTFGMGNGYSTDLHELRFTDDGHYWCLGYDPQIVDMDTVVQGGQPGATVIGLIVQELDSEDNVVFQWRSWDHFQITDASYWISMTDSIIDYVHGNSIAFDSDTSILISCRNMDEITKIDRRTGEIIWRWNGENDMFTYLSPEDIKFSVQHSIREMDNGHFSVFDNATQNTPSPHSSNAVEYLLDEDSLTVTQILRFHRTPPVHADVMGHAQRLENGNTICGWGPAIPSVTEFDAGGNMLFEISFNYTNYRAFKFKWETTLFDIDTDTLDFGNIWWQNEKASLSFKVINKQDTNLLINRLVKHDSPFFTDVEIPFILGPNEEKTFNVSIIPDSLGSFFDVLTFCHEIDVPGGGLKQRIGKQIFIKAENYDPGSITENSTEGSVFPNPSNGKFRIKSDNDYIENINIYSPEGQRIYRESEIGQKTFDINLEGKSRGIYLVNVEFDNGGRHFLKLVVQ